MTDLPLSPNSQPVPSLDSTASAANATPPLSNTLPTNGVDDDEDYTIKCICGFQEDDGSTILCETCQTWQHIECYYASQGQQTPGEEENHYCHECEPRKLDRNSAAESQRAKRDITDVVDPKTKKPNASKGGHRKKKASDHATNGWSSDKHDGVHRNGTNSSPRETSSSAKRPKTSHRSSNSVQTVSLKLPGQSSRRSASASHPLQSPSKSSHKSSRFEGEPYSVQFMHLYDNDPGDTPMQNNMHHDITTLNKLLDWSRDADAVKEAANGRSHQEIFMRCDQSVDDMERPVIQKRTKTDDTREFHERHPKWTYLTVETEAPEGMIVGELRGIIGHKKNYVQDPNNRWEWLRHPVPFVFFHPTLPIYIDTRTEGTICRYVRRSCNPSLKLITILENGSDSPNGSQLRFCFSATRTLVPGDELTLAWTPDEHVRATVAQLNNTKPEDVDPEEKNYVKEYFRRVFSDFGGCACEDADECRCFKWMRSQTDPKLVNGKSKKGRKTPNQPRTRRTPSSRSGSEAVKQHDDDDQDDDRSTSASSRSKPQSRDATPPELTSDREKRKFEQQLERIAHLEQEERKPKKAKKSRASGGNTNPPASASRLTFPDNSGLKSMSSEGLSASVPSTPATTGKPRYMDAGTIQKRSSSPQLQYQPHNATSRTVPAWGYPRPQASPKKPVYVDTGTQVDMDEEKQTPKPAFHRRPVISLTKRLLKRCHMERVELDKKREESIRDSKTPSQSPTMPVDPKFESPTSVSAASQSKDKDGDTEMGDADVNAPSKTQTADGLPEKPKSSDREAPWSNSVISAGVSPKPKAESPEMPAPALPPLSERLAESKIKEERASLNGYRAADLHVQLPSPPPLASSSAPLVSSSATASSPVVQTPTSMTNTPLFTPTSSSLVQPSPVKKKLSLGDYMSRRSSNIQKLDSVTSPAPTTGSAEKEQSPIMVDGLPRHLESLAEEAKEQGVDPDSAIIETPKAEVVDPMVLGSQAAAS